MTPLDYLKAGLGGLLLVIAAMFATVSHTRGNTIAKLTVENTRLQSAYDTDQVLLKDLNDKFTAAQVDLQTAQAKSQQVRVVTETKIQKIYQATVPEDCAGALATQTNLMQQTLKGRTK